MSHIALVLSAALVAAAPAGAQPREGRPQRDEAFKMIDAYLLSNLQESLGLGDEQYVKLLPLVKKHQEEQREGAARRVRALMELRRTLQSGRATEAAIGALLEEVKRAESEVPARNQRNQQAVDAALTPLQQAKYRVLEAEVERKVRELLRRAVRGRALERRERQRESETRRPPQ